MKTLIVLSACLLFCPPLRAEYRQWTNTEGKSVDLELIEVIDKDGEKAGRFRMKDGRVVTIKASTLAQEDAKTLDGWVAPGKSVFEKVLEGNLVKLEGKTLEPVKNIEKPAKYYVFYHTASWCGPCHQFTPSLVQFYQKNKNRNFELVLITHDQEVAAMTHYAAEMKMPWPQLKLTKAGAFMKEFPQGVNGIPAVIVCDLQGKVLGNYRSNLGGLAELVK